MIISTRISHSAIFWQYTRFILDVYFNACHCLVQILSFWYGMIFGGKVLVFKGCGLDAILKINPWRHDLHAGHFNNLNVSEIQLTLC